MSMFDLFDLHQKCRTEHAVDMAAKDHLQVAAREKIAALETSLHNAQVAGASILAAARDGWQKVEAELRIRISELQEQLADLHERVADLTNAHSAETRGLIDRILAITAPPAYRAVATAEHAALNQPAADKPFLDRAAAGPRPARPNPPGGARVRPYAPPEDFGNRPVEVPRPASPPPPIAGAGPGLDPVTAVLEAAGGNAE